MKAAVVHSFTSPLSLEDIPKPEPAPGQVVVKIEASGLCHTDIHAAHGDWPIKPTLPLIPGHEGVGIVESVGPMAPSASALRWARRTWVRIWGSPSTIESIPAATSNRCSAASSS